MSNIKMIANQRIEVVNNPESLTLRVYHNNQSSPPSYFTLQKSELSEMIELLQEAERLFDLTPEPEPEPAPQSYRPLCPGPIRMMNTIDHVRFVRQEEAREAAKRAYEKCMEDELNGN